MKKKLLVLLCACVAGSTLLVTGCSEKKETPQVTTEKEKEEKIKTIGIEKDADYKVELKNNTGKKIIGLSVKLMEQAEYPANMLSSGDVFEIGESRNLFYKQSEAVVTEDVGDKMLNPGFDVQLIFEDQSVFELHAFPFDDITRGEICFEELAYLKYESKSSKQKVETKEAELAVKSQKEAAEAAKAAAEEAARQAEEAARKAAEEEAARQAAEAARKAAEEEAARQAAEAARQQEVQQNNSQNNTPAEEDGCVQDGLLW